jgi:hypothetical protein
MRGLMRSPVVLIPSIPQVMKPSHFVCKAAFEPETLELTLPKKPECNKDNHHQRARAELGSYPAF